MSAEQKGGFLKIEKDLVEESARWSSNGAIKLRAEFMLAADLMRKTTELTAEEAMKTAKAILSTANLNNRQSNN